MPHISRVASVLACGGDVAGQKRGRWGARPAEGRPASRTESGRPGTCRTSRHCLRIVAVSRLLWRDAQGVEGSVELGTGELLVGRALECAIRTEDAMVSRHHARVILVKWQYVVEDLGSSNGIFYQEQRIMRHPLRHGDAVRCGSLWLRFVEAPMASPHSRAPTDLPPIGSGSGLPTFAGPGGAAVPVAVHGDRTHGALLPGQGMTSPEEMPARLR